MRHKSTDIWLLALLFAGLLVGGYYIARPEKRAEFTVSTTYNADPKGVKAFYTLLHDKLGYDVARLEEPYTKLPRRARVLIVVQPDNGEAPEKLGFMPSKGIDDDESDALLRWTNRGGAVMFLADDLTGVPASFGSTQRMGKGMVYAFNTRSAITNEGVRDYRNAVRLLGIIDAHASKRDLILFDEYHHGVREGGSLWSYVSRQAKVSMAILLVTGLVLCYSFGRRFGAVRALPVQESVRPGYEFVESVARLYRRARATDLAAIILCRSFTQELCLRLGLPSDAPRERIVARLGSDARGEVVARVDTLLAKAHTAQAGQKPSEQELLDIAREVRLLEKELGLGS